MRPIYYLLLTWIAIFKPQNDSSTRFSLSQFNRIISGVTFLQHINNLRLEAAEDLLKYTKKSCNQIAIEAGFPSARTFNNVFNRKHNMTPLQYRKLHKETQNITTP